MGVEKAKQRPPSGVIAVMTFPDGQVVATATDFHLDRMGGCTLREAQTMRVRRALVNRVMEALCHPDIVKAAEFYHAEQTVRRLEVQCGYRRTIINVGGEDADG